MGLFSKKKKEEEQEKIEFLESEIDTDETDEDIPVATLVKLADEEAPVEQEVAEETAAPEEELLKVVDEEETPVEEESAAEEPIIEEVEETPIEEEPVVEDVEEPAEEEIAEPVQDEQPEEVQEEAPVEETTEETKEEPVQEEPVEEEIVAKPVVASEKIHIDGEPNDGANEKNLKKDMDGVLGADYKVEEPAPQPKPKKQPSQAKKPDKEIWGKVVFAKKEEPKAEPKKEEPKKAPAKKAPAKKVEKVEPVEEKKEEVKPAPKKAPAKAAAPVKAEEKPVKEPAKTTKKTNKDKEEVKTMAKYDPEKIVTASGATTPHGKFVIRKTDNDNFVFKLISSNKRVVAIGAQAYSGLPGVKGGIQSVIKNAAKAPIQDSTLQKVVELKFPKWEIWQDKKGEFRLRLYASNGELVASTNDGYTGKPAAKAGIDAIARACIDCDIVRNDDPKAY